PLQLLQDEGADLLRGELLVVDLDVPVGAHLALDRADRAVDVGHRLPLRDLADQHLAVLGEGNHGRRGSRPLCVCDDRWLAALKHSDDRVGGPEVDAYSTCHVLSLIQSCSKLSPVDASLPGPGAPRKLLESIWLNFSARGYIPAAQD